jgi:hypothetical protein
MTQRSIFAGKNQTIIIKSGGSVSVRGHEGDRLIAEGKGGVTVERRSEAEIGRARAAIGDHVLFDLRIKLPSPLRPSQSPTGGGDGEVIEVQIGWSGEVFVPFESNLKVYAGKDIDVHSIKGQVDAYSGLHLHLQGVDRLGNASAGGAMNLDCQTMLGTNVEFKCGRDLRFHVHDLSNARIRVRDLAGYWEGRIGGGEKSVYLKSGGDVTVVTNRTVEALPPNYILGKIEKPTKA